MEEMLQAVRLMHRTYRFAKNGGEDPYFRMSLLMEEVGEICQCLTKGIGDLSEEHADLLIVLLGNCVALGIDLESAFWRKMSDLRSRSVVTKLGHSRLAKESNDDR